MSALVPALALLVALQEQEAPPVPEPPPLAHLEGTIRMPDGVELAHELVHLEGPGPWPVMLVRSCYPRGIAIDQARPMVAAGLALFVQSVRGTGKSGGEWDPFRNEAADGAATLDWVLAQPWCNGRVATNGRSYLGIAQWQLAPLAGERIAAMSTHFASADLLRDVIHFGGVQGLAVPLPWSETVAGHRGMPRLKALPLIEADDACGHDLESWNEWCRHPLLDDYWKPLDFAAKYAEVHAPVLLVAGWFDLFQPGQIDDYMELARRKGPADRAFTRLVVGPWDHGGFEWVPGRPDLGEAAWKGPMDEEQQFYERFLLGRENGFEARAGVRAFFLGENRWRELASWPPPGAERASFFLRSLGGAGKKPAGDGLLSEGRAETRAPADAPRDAFVYRPDDPCPSYAGSLWVPLSTLSDQRAIAQRGDVLVYETAPLAEPVTIAGPIELELWITSSAPDTDFAAKLVDVAPPAPDGTPGASTVMEWRGEGIQRARLRDGWTAADEKLLEPGVPARLAIRMGHVAATFAAGHRIGLHVTSSNFPRFSRNLNTAERSNVARRPAIARQQVLHDSEHPSRLLLWKLPTGAREADAREP
jgi:putative CocE/NonD family hydrolase